MDNATLSPPPTVPSYLITGDRPRINIKPSQRYIKVDLVEYALSMVEDIQSSKEFLTDSVCCGDFVIAFSTLFGNLCIICEFVTHGDNSNNFSTWVILLRNSWIHLIEFVLVGLCGRGKELLVGEFC